MDVSINALQWTSPSLLSSAALSPLLSLLLDISSSALAARLSVLLLRVRLCLLLRFIHTQNMLLSTCYSSGVCSSESVTLVVLPE